MLYPGPPPLGFDPPPPYVLGTFLAFAVLSFAGIALGEITWNAWTYGKLRRTTALLRIRARRLIRRITGR